MNYRLLASFLDLYEQSDEYLDRLAEEASELLALIHAIQSMRLSHV